MGKRIRALAKNKISKSPMETESIGKLMAKFAIPCIISLLVNALYNIVDQIFIGRGVGYLGNGATNVVFHITIIALAFALLIGDGCASYLSLKLGEKQADSAAKGVGNSIIMLSVVGIIFLVVTFLSIDKIITFFGCTDLIRPYALDFGYNYGAKKYERVKKTLLISMILATVVSAIGFIVFYFFPQPIINLFGAEEGLYNEFAIKCFRIFLLLCIFNGFQTVAGIFFQALGKPVKSAIISLSRQIVFLVPAAIILPRFLGVEGVLWSGPLADGLAFLLAFVYIAYEMRHLTKKELSNSSDGLEVAV